MEKRKWWEYDAKAEPSAQEQAAGLEPQRPIRFFEAEMERAAAAAKRKRRVRPAFGALFLLWCAVYLIRSR